MADRRTDESTPLAPRRSLGGPAKTGKTGDTGGAGAEKRPLTERVSSAISSVGGSRASRSSRSDSTTRRSRSASHADGPAPSRASPSASPVRSRTRRARLRLLRVDPWSVMKTAFLLSIAFGIVTVISVAVVWSVLSAAGVWDSINSTVQEVIGGESGSTFDVENYVGTSRVMGFTMIVAVVDVVLITAIATLGAFLYNLSAALLGGIEVTLAEDER